MGIGTPWIDVPAAVICLLAGLVQVGLAATRRVAVLPAVADAVMATGMAAMFLPTLVPVPQGVWVAAFLLIGAWFGATAVQTQSMAGAAGHHVVSAAAMLFMLLGLGHGSTDAAAGGEHAGHAAAAGGSSGLLTTAIALAFAAWFIVDLLRRFTGSDPGRPALAPVGPSGPTAGTAGQAGAATAVRPVTARLATASHTVMSVAMIVMFLAMS